MDVLLNKLLEAEQVNQVTDVINDLSEKEDVGWEPVGGKQNNLATINIGSDPAAGVIERITNAIDAVLEREWEERGRPEGVDSPREAVAQWFGIDEGRLNSVENPRDTDFASLAERVQVVLRDSEKVGHPTVDIRDNGLGIEAKDFSTSILSLNESLKLQKHFLAGAFGQGGSTALSYSIYTIILSKTARVDEKKSNQVAATIVRFNPGDVERDKHGKYEYMVDKRTDVPFTFEANTQEFVEGTLVRHVAMDLGKYDSVMTTQTRSLWYLTQHYLFDPVLPFRIEEQRDNSSKGARRTVTGNHRLLSQGENTVYPRDAELTFRSGTVRIHWWVLSDKGKNPKGRIRQYTLKSKPVVVTYNGQKQGEMSNRIIKDDLKLPYLEGYLVVHVDCDDLDNESRRQLFSTTRESLRENNVMEDLRRLVVDTLKGDPELPKLDEQRKQRFMSREDSESVAKVRKRLANRIKAFKKTGGGSESTSVGDSGRTDDRESDREPIPVEDPPTFIEITTDGPKQIHPGRRFALRFKTDAHPSYFRKPETFVSAVDPASVGHYTGTASVKEGHGTAYFEVDEEAEIEATGKVMLEVRPPDVPSIRDEIEVKVVPSPESSGEGSGSTKTPNINPMLVGKEDDIFREENWDGSSVAKVISSEKSTDVYVSAENKKLNKVIKKAQRRSGDAIENVKNFYLEHIAFHAVLADLGKNGEVQETEEEEVEDGSELKRACETVCGIMDDMFGVIVK